MKGSSRGANGVLYSLCVRASYFVVLVIMCDVDLECDILQNVITYDIETGTMVSPAIS